MHTWTAQFIAPEHELDAAPLLRREFVLDEGHGPLVTATLYYTALGIVEAFINGAPVSPDVLTPGWTSFEWRLRYVEQDVTAFVDANRVVVGLALGDGWFHGSLGWHDRVRPYGSKLAGIAELHLTFADGHHQRVISDDAWQSGRSAVTANSLYDGQKIDARRTQPGWASPGFDTSGWSGVRPVAFDRARLAPAASPPVRRQEELTPQRVWESPSGKTLVDFGQNLVGWVRVSVRGDAGDSISIRHAEVLEHDELGVRPLRGAAATDRFTMSGGDDLFEPTFTFHGFRYIELTGWPGGIEALQDGGLVAVVVSSELRRIGRFSCSNPLLNRLHENVVWGMRGNFLALPTDCPQRDERLGWTGDIAVFAPTAAYLFDTSDFLRDWLRDLALEQQHNGDVVPFVVPDLLKHLGHPPEFEPLDSTAIWSDAAVWVPWALWEAYGDPSVLGDAFPSISAHTRHVRSLLSANGVWDSGFQFGDWLDPDAPAERADEAKADPGVVATASLYRTACMARDAAGILDRESDRKEFDALAASVRAAFCTVYVDGRRIRSDCTTVYALAIAFELLDAADTVWAGARLAELVEASGFRISTGFAGTPFIMDALSSTGHVDTAYRLLLEQQCPSWLYPVTMGATTIWERWDSMLPEGRINPGEMTSFNHYALGAVADWMHRTLGGLAPLEPGYRRLLIHPRPGGGLDWAESSLETPFGLASVRWESSSAGLRIDVKVPQSVTALLRIDSRPDRELEPGHHTISSS
ncbi:alpha-L-rhamnosidase [Paramicrobacterium chengjingii]|uniref:alpha-L-rhamnosidase n=1 Tax=Paramicrobacterium chengjingii TaxID=2769067 RepID=UPI0014203263|nr:alpha-L-rhamnosidase [Microbacterium chengjingii]